MEEEKHKLIKHILDQYQNKNIYEHKSNGWYETKIQKDLTTEEILDIIKKFAKNNGNIFMILDKLPEEVIQEYLRAKKLAKIKKKSK